MDSINNIQPSIRRVFILSFVALFFINILLICYEINTGFEKKSDEMNRINAIDFILSNNVNSMIILFSSLGMTIVWQHNFPKRIVCQFCFLLIFYILFVILCRLNCKLWTEYRAHIQFIELIVNQILIFIGTSTE